MSLEPSFRSLFRRSRFARAEEDEASGQLQNQKEMFAVAAVAFTLKYDEKFRKYFFREICGFEESVKQPGAIIEVQAHHHSDLVIKQKPSSLSVIEFKIGAKLRTNRTQNTKRHSSRTVVTEIRSSESMLGLPENATSC